MYIFVEEYIGGLGNQLYQYSNLIYLAKVYKKVPIMLNQDISLGYVNSIVYKNIFNLIEKNKDEVYKNLYYINYEQFEKKEYDLNLDLKSYNICLKGLNMNIYNFKHILYDIRNILNIKESIIENNCLISFRSFNEESIHEWRINKEYYIKAIKYAIDNIDNIYFSIFTDDYNYAYDIIKNIPQLNEKYTIYSGKRDGLSDIEHFKKMMECNHAILCNSSFATWSMILNNNNDNKIIIPNNTFLDNLGIDEITGTIIRI